MQPCLSISSDSQLRLLADEWVRNRIDNQYGASGQTLWLMEELAALCVAETLNDRGDRDQLCRRLNEAWDVVYGIWRSVAPSFATSYYPDKENLGPQEQDKIQRAKHIVWQRCNPKNGFPGGSLFDRPSISHGPDGPDLAILIRDDFADVVTSYLERPWLRHPTIDWIIVDILVSRELCAYYECLYRPSLRRDPMAVFLIMRALYWLNRRIFSPLFENFEPVKLFHEMYDVWFLLKPPVVNPARVREALEKSTSAGASWDPIVWSIVDRAITHDRSVWTVWVSSKKDRA